MSQSKANPSISRPIKPLSPEGFAVHMVFLFYPFIDEKERLSSLPPKYQDKLQKERV